MTIELMTSADIERVTGKKRYSKQVAWFREQFGVTVAQRSDGSPVMTWNTLEALIAKCAGVAIPSTPLIPERPPLRPVFSKRTK
jgi:hypothetical protein